MSEKQMETLGIAALTCVAVIVLNQYWKNTGGRGLESFAPVPAPAAP